MFWDEICFFVPNIYDLFPSKNFITNSYCDFQIIPNIFKIGIQKSKISIEEHIVYNFPPLNFSPIASAMTANLQVLIWFMVYDLLCIWANFKKQKKIFVKREVGFTIIHMLSLLILIYFSILVCYPVTSLMHAKMDRTSGKPTFDRAFCLRMKSTLTKRGCHFKSSGYRVCKIKKYYVYTYKVLGL